jgi:hypothetical protein
MALGLPPCSLNISLIPNYPQFALHDSRNLYEIIKPPTYIIIYIYDWIGLRENLQEPIKFKYRGFL